MIFLKIDQYLQIFFVLISYYCIYVSANLKINTYGSTIKNFHTLHTGKFVLVSSEKNSIFFTVFDENGNFHIQNATILDKRQILDYNSANINNIILIFGIFQNTSTSYFVPFFIRYNSTINSIATIKIIEDYFGIGYIGQSLAYNKVTGIVPCAKNLHDFYYPHLIGLNSYGDITWDNDILSISEIIRGYIKSYTSFMNEDIFYSFYSLNSDSKYIIKTDKFGYIVSIHFVINSGATSAILIRGDNIIFSGIHELSNTDTFYKYSEDFETRTKFKLNMVFPFGILAIIQTSGNTKRKLTIRLFI